MVQGNHWNVYGRTLPRHCFVVYCKDWNPLQHTTLIYENLVDIIVCMWHY